MLRSLMLASIAAIALSPASAWAAILDASVGAQSIVVVDARQGEVAVRAASGERLRISSPRGRLERKTYTPMPGDDTIEILPTSTSTLGGRRIELPTESFTFTPLAAGRHTEIRLHGDGVGRVEIDVPQTVSALVVKLRRGRLSVDGLTHGITIAKIQRGAITVTRFSGSAYLQVADGPIVMRDSVLRHVRLRTGTSAIVLRDCTITQARASSVTGDVIVDNAAFTPGLARFDSHEGAVAVGFAAGGAQVSGTTGRGHVFTLLDERSHPQIDEGSVGSAIHGGGPSVTMRSDRANLFLYDGTLLGATPPSPWRRILSLLQRSSSR